MLLGRTGSLRYQPKTLLEFFGRGVKYICEGASGRELPRGSLSVQVSDTRRDLHEIENAGRKASRAVEKPQGLLEAR